jgi:ubiquitin-conjugating enzyme (huntingtin interacting protein 2)
LSTNWSPVQTIKTALLSLRLLLEVPNPQDPQDAEVARMMIDDPVRFARTAQAWAIEYAGAPKRDLDLKPFEDMEKNKPGAKDNQRYDMMRSNRAVQRGA